MIRLGELHSHLRLLAQNQLSLDQFEDWFMSASRAMHIDSDNDAIELAAQIHHLLAERDDHIHDADSLRQGLLALLDDAHSSAEQVFQIVVRISVDRVSAANYAWPVPSSNQIIQFPPVVVPLQA